MTASADKPKYWLDVLLWSTLLFLTWGLLDFHYGDKLWPSNKAIEPLDGFVRIGPYQQGAPLQFSEDNYLLEKRFMPKGYQDATYLGEGWVAYRLEDNCFTRDITHHNSEITPMNCERMNALITLFLKPSHKTDMDMAYL
ncbi:hypothetical protein [Neptuniibacter sp. QD37_11]|uniref:hypothetical protein n=1 Tax=Neptuniibacter sp. QD37_11 TaxID=3398209 RepID=UPI0039F4B225